MTRQELPWTITEEPKLIKRKRTEMQLKEVQSKTEESLPVSTARIVKFLNENKNNSYTNRQIATEVGLSGSTVSGVMDKLEEIGCVKVVKLRKSATSGISQVYQSIEGGSTTVEKEREVEGYISKVLSIFNRNLNKTYSKNEIAANLGISKDKVGQALSILLITEKVKIVELDEGDLIYQSMKGKGAGIPVTKESNKNYMTLGNYIKTSGIKGDFKELKEKIASERGRSRLFYSDKGIVKEYEVSYLQKILGFGKIKETKKGLLERIKVW